MKFLLDSEGILKYSLGLKYNEHESFLIDEDVTIYDYLEEDIHRSHLIYLQKDGNLNYIVFNDGRMEESTLSRFDTKSNSYNQIAILIIKSKINIFYSYSNIINSNIYTLHHVVIGKKIEEKYAVIRYVSKKNPLSFSVASDSSGNIYLFYNTISESFSFIYYTYFNPYKNSWLTNPIKISSLDRYCINPSIYVDSKNNVHGIWWEKNKMGFILRYNRMSSSGKEQYKWTEIILPSTIEDNPESKVYELDNNILIDCSSYILISKDFGLNWSEEITTLSLDDGTESQTKANSIPIDENISHFENDENDDMFPIYTSIIDQMLINQKEIKIQLTDIIMGQQEINSTLLNLEEKSKKTNLGWKRFFSN